MPKLHELLAAEGTAKAQADKTRTDLLGTFDKKRHLFSEKTVTFVSTMEGVPPKTEEQSAIQTSVRKELKWIADIWAKALDLAYNIDTANQQAKADVMLDSGTPLLTGVPATALLQLEKRIADIRSLIQNVPTLDPAKGFKPDMSREAGVYAANAVVKNRTKKEQRPLVLYPATSEHPAQTQLIVEDVVIGTVSEQEWSSLITPAEKSDILNRVEEVLRAVKTARARANDIKVEGAKIGGTLFGYILNG